MSKELLEISKPSTKATEVEPTKLHKSRQLAIGYVRACSCEPTHINCMSAKEWIVSQLRYDIFRSKPPILETNHVDGITPADGGSERMWDDLEICSCCGRSVGEASPLFANRVPELNDAETRVEIGRRFPRGGWVCIECDNTDSDGLVHDLDHISFSIKHGRALRAAVEAALRRRSEAGRWN
jgi:hypothetical protein